MGGEIDLLFEIVDESADAEDMERASRGLRQELAEMESVSTSMPEAAAEPGAKGDLNLLGTIAVSMISSAVPAVVALVGRWAQDRGRCVVRVSKPDGTTLEIPHVLEREQIDRIVSSLISE
jgi:hypothetical protein